MRRQLPSRIAVAGAAVLIVTVAAAARGLHTSTPEREPASTLVTTGFTLAIAPLAAREIPTVLGGSAAIASASADADDDVEAALRALAPSVGRTSHADALRTAFSAYYNYRRANPDAVRKPYFYFVDFGLSNSTPRGWVFDMDRLELVEGPFTVAHGRGSSRVRNEVPKSFSNRPGSKATSLGLYLAQEKYSFGGKAGGSRYSSIGLRMKGESGEFNNAARRRGVVAHGAPYVTKSGAGRSEGCPAMEMARARRLLPKLANGGVVFIYSPNASNWLSRDPWLQSS